MKHGRDPGSNPRKLNPMREDDGQQRLAAAQNCKALTGYKSREKPEWLTVEEINDLEKKMEVVA